ncbi:hypothetical protein [Prevotella koreensis]
MNYDITMCNNFDCNLSECCARYSTYQHYMKDTDDNKPSLISIYEGRGEKCAIFKELNNMNGKHDSSH